MTVAAGCTVACTATPECQVCGKVKALRGRSYPLAMGGGRCDHECPGYDQEPHAGHLWFSEWDAHERGDHRGCFDDCPPSRPCMECARVGCRGCDGEDASTVGAAK